MVVAQAPDDVQQMLGIVVNLGFTPGVYGQVVPGRHSARILGLARIVAGTDIGVGPGKHHQGFGTVFQCLPLPVGAGEVAVEGAVAALAAIQQQWQVAGLQALFTLGNQHGQAGLLNLPVQLAEVGFLVARRCEHEDCPWRMVQS
ncbi:hypothetical protein D3C75_950390 [compost metagenome]